MSSSKLALAINVIYASDENKYVVNTFRRQHEADEYADDADGYNDDDDDSNGWCRSRYNAINYCI